ncbi:MAG TPA: hypothetical protein VLB46_03025 [Pyrinomonadaceae bacterium]|nr:hypothetical protein [Pyrinomonadaceae bacterium]
MSVPTIATDWDINLRTNLRLWPDAAPNIRALANCGNQNYDERALLSNFPEYEGKTPTDPRAVRNTFEVLSYAGFMYRDGNPEQLLLTPLGQNVFDFLGVTGDKRYANMFNIKLVSELIIRALSVVVECRAIWMLMLRTDMVLSNEELNRAMAALSDLSDVDLVAEKILRARADGDVTTIGDRLYKPDEFGTSNESDQRKAMNPHFLLAGGGGLFIEFGGEEMRRLAVWAPQIINRSLGEDSLFEHASTSKDFVLRLSRRSGASLDVR